MIRTQVYLTEEQSQTIKRRSQQEQKPEAEIIRELLDNGLVASNTTKRKSTGETLIELATLGEKLGLKGPTDLSTNLDDYLYGDKK